LRVALILNLDIEKAIGLKPSKEGGKGQKLRLQTQDQII